VAKILLIEFLLPTISLINKLAPYQRKGIQSAKEIEIGRFSRRFFD
jgi:hypothetical protein